MHFILEIIVYIVGTIIFREFIVNILGYGTMKVIYKLTGNQQGLEWLRNQNLTEGDVIHRDVLMIMVGFFTFMVLIGILVYLVT